MQVLKKKGYWIDPLVKAQLDQVRKRVLKKDRDFVAVIDGEEGSGKSVLAQQIAKYLDPNFSLDNITFNADQFLKLIKDEKTKKGTCIILDEAFSAANSRSSLTEVNKSMIGVATEMRQKNLFILMCIPSFFDLDKYFALWRCKTLIHVYISNDEDRRYIIFNKDRKKMLYLTGKKTYSYAKPRAAHIPFTFPNHYTVDETEYRFNKAEAFRKRVVSHQARIWLGQRNSYIKYCSKYLGKTQEQIANVPEEFGARPLSQDTVHLVLKDFESNEQ